MLRNHGVDFMIVGGQAAQFHGSSRVTFDTDLAYRRTQTNLERLASALNELHPTLRGAPPDLPYQIDARSLSLGSNFTFSTDLGPLDLLGWVEPIGDFDALMANAVEVDFEGTPVVVLGLDDLIRVKEHVRRDKDLAALAELYAIRDERDRQARP